MRGVFSRASAAIVSVLLFGVTACGSASDDGDGGDAAAENGTQEEASGEQAGEQEDESTPEPEPAERQDLCAELDDATLTEIAAALGESAEIEEYADEANTDPTPPIVDRCYLPFSGRPLEPPDTDDGDEVIIEGDDSGEGELKLTLTVPEMSQSDFDRMRDGAAEAADGMATEVNDVAGVGDAAFYATAESKVLVGDRVLSIDVPQISEEEFVAVAEAILPVVEELPAAPAEVPQPECDEVTEAAKAAVGEEDVVRRDTAGDSEDDPRPHCIWATATKTFRTHVSTGVDDPEHALRRLRQDSSVESVDVGDEGFLVTSPSREVIFRSGDYHYEAAFWAVNEDEGSKPEMIAALQRFADALE